MFFAWNWWHVHVKYGQVNALQRQLKSTLHRDYTPFEVSADGLKEQMSNENPAIIKWESEQLLRTSSCGLSLPAPSVEGKQEIQKAPFLAKTFFHKRCCEFHFRCDVYKCMKTQEVIDEKVSKATITPQETVQMNLLTAICHVMQFLKFKPHAVSKNIHLAFVSDFSFSKRANIRSRRSWNNMSCRDIAVSDCSLLNILFKCFLLTEVLFLHSSSVSLFNYGDATALSIVFLTFCSWRPS